MKNRKIKRKLLKHIKNRVIDFEKKRIYHYVINKVGGKNDEKKIVLYFNANSTFAK